eukprot:TRINITY_DN4590_c0_g1_i3.p1 TRINITY_DN4590_c0_g1~~TRINITY_DN4590_c0_g1_i3.p1  ORF type:complete len:195 (+),score=11.92 TRINITY_DN4590_c0_g1_i3:776-1360(+)
MLHFGRIGVPEIESLVLERFFNRRLEKVEKLIGGDGIILDYLEDCCCCCCWLIQINSTNVSLSFYIELPWNQLHLRFFNSTKKSSFKLMQTELQDFPRSVRIIVNLSSQNEIYFPSIQRIHYGLGLLELVLPPQGGGHYMSKMLIFVVLDEILQLILYIFQQNDQFRNSDSGRRRCLFVEITFLVCRLQNFILT